MDHISNETEYAINSSGGGRGYGGGGFGGGSIWDMIALGMVSGGDGIFGGRGRRDDYCCPQPATAASVCEVDKDVLSTANQTQHEICEAAHGINAAITAGNTHITDKITSGFYTVSDKLTSLAYAQQATAKDTQTLIVEKFAALESKQLSAENCRLEQEVNRFKTVAALSDCKGKS